MLDCRRLLVLLALLFLASCGEDESDAESPLQQGSGGGIVVDSTGALEAVEGLVEGQGKLIVEGKLAGEPVTNKLVIKLHPLGAPDTDSGSGPGGQEYTLAPGEYEASLVYTHDEAHGSFEGTLGGLEVRAGQASRYHAQLTVPLGILVVRFVLQDRAKQAVDISADVKLALYKATDDTDLVEPTWQGRAGEEALLPKGKYQLKASYAPAKGRAEVSEWHKDIEVGATLTRTEKKIVLAPEPLGVRIDVYNYSRDINAGTKVFFFTEGADMSRAIARAEGIGGHVVEVPGQIRPGKYDILLLYQPSPMTNPDLQIRKLIAGFEIPKELQAQRVPIDLETPLGTIRVKVNDGKEDVSDRVDMRVMRAGAFKDAATPALEASGVSEHFLPAGTYDLYFEWKDADGTGRGAEFIGVQLGNGFVWEQQFDRRSSNWEAAPTRTPPKPLHPISWTASGDDDDSAGDDDDSSAPAPGGG